MTIIYKNELPTTRDEAKRLGSKWYFTNKPCIRNHIEPRFTSIGTCMRCARENTMAKHTHTTSKRRSYNDLKSFIEKAKIVHKNLYSYEKVKYVNAHTKVIITCTVHGDFAMSPTNHICGKGCKLCNRDVKLAQTS